MDPEPSGHLDKGKRPAVVDVIQPPPKSIKYDSDEEEYSSPFKNPWIGRIKKTMEGLKLALTPPKIPSSDSDVIQVRHLDPKTLRSKILHLVNGTCDSLVDNKGFSFKLSKYEPSYDASLGYYVNYRHSLKSRRNVVDVYTARKASLYAQILDKIYELSHIETSLPGSPFYFDDDTPYLYDCIDDLCAHFECTRATLRVFPATSKGLVHGGLDYAIGSELFKCDNKSDVVSIPLESEMDSLKIINHAVDFILIVEKESVFKAIRDSSFCAEYHCLLITGKGEPDVSTRLFAYKMRYDLNVPVFGLMDATIRGIQIMSVYKHGSMKKAFQNHQMAIPDLKWIGGDLPNEGDGDSKLEDNEKNMLRLFLTCEWVIENEKLKEKIEHMLHSQTKFQIDHVVRPDYLIKEYLPSRLASAEYWI